jgi:MFS family permease
VRLAGESASPEWCANVNPIVVMLLIVPVTRLSRSLAPRTAIGLAIALVAVSSFVMGLGPALSTLTGPAVALPLGITAHPYSLVLVAGAAISGVAECFLLPRWYEHVSGLAPPGQTAMYVGWSALNGLWANVLGYGLSGWLVEHWCPDPATLPAPAAEALARFVAGTGPLPGEYARAHAIWFVFAGIAVAAAAAAWVHARIMVRGAPPATR